MTRLLRGLALATKGDRRGAMAACACPPLLAIAMSACAAPSEPARPARTASTAEPNRSAVSLFRYPWSWTDEQGHKVRFATWRGEPLVVTLMYTSCRRTCPETIRTMRTIFAIMNRDRRFAQFVLVTLDPENDTPERLREFKRSERLPDVVSPRRAT